MPLSQSSKSRCTHIYSLQSIERRNSWRILQRELDLERKPCRLQNVSSMCTCLRVQVEYRKYCSRKYGRVIDYPILSDVASETSAQERCKKLWTILYPKEPFDVLATLCKLPGGFGKSNQALPLKDIDGSELVRELVPVVDRQSSFYYQVSQPYMWEDVFLRAARERYKCFLHLLRKSQGRILCVPTFDIDLMWHAHQQVPVAYAKDTESIIGCVVDHHDNLERGPGTKLGNGFEDTARLWESTYGHPYEKAGTLYRGSKPVNLPAPPASEVTGSTQVLERVPVILPWDYRCKDENAVKYPVLSPRHVSQVCVAIKGSSSMMAAKGKESGDLFVRLKALESYKLLKVDAPVAPFSIEPQWQKLWSLQCEVKTKGVILELRYHVDGCFRTLRKTKRLGGTKITWQELQKTPMLSQEAVLTVGKKRFSPDTEKRHPLQLCLGISMTPPVQGSYLLKSVPDRVTDDKGQMLSSTIVRMRRNQPQSGRWVSRTVLNHAGKENFVIRIRAAKGIWKKSGDRPVGVDWNERVINVHEGGWNYIAHGIGIAREKIVGTATPLAHELEEYKLSWALSTGDTLIISRQMGDVNWERHLEFTLKTSGPSAGVARLVNGRKLQYEVAGATSEEEDGFVTLIRYTPQSPQGRATALFNFKVSVMEVVPQEDVLLVLLLCTATLRSIADFGGLTSGNVYTRRRAKENRPGLKDWGSVVLENGSKLSHLSSWHVKCADYYSDDEDDADGEKLPGRIAADWGGEDSRPGSVPGSVAGSMRMRYLPPAAAVAHEVAVQATTGMWGRRTGSGVQVDPAHLR
ncbi:hypothetical protein KC19_1G204700 [Ceratodon purpureus]|uniref:GRPD C-terminal domain-containing protein n=1 Tax=Ceratodon purpureus TaxID=3225 RepID=A0A8T0J9M0_CERPU|nr:hypothetical protein KC19_1G204700 [Ceratodon purpureus]